MYDTITTICSHLVTFLVFLIGNSISIVEYCNNTFPKATHICLQLFAIYVAYRIAKRIVTSWINMILFVLKFILFTVAVIFALTIYLRGTKFVEQDIPFLQNLIERFNSGEMRYLMNNLSSMFYNSFLSSMLGLKSQHWESFTDGFSDKQEYSQKNSKRKSTKGKYKNKKDKGKQFEKDAINMLNDYGIEIDEGYLDYINENFGFQENKENVGNFMDNLNGALNGLGIDMNHVADFVDRFN